MFENIAKAINEVATLIILFSPLIYMIYNRTGRVYNKMQFSKFLVFRTKVNKKILETLKHLLSVTMACRVYVFDFHNNKLNAIGIPYVFMSNTFEVCRPNVTKQIQNLQNISTAEHGDFMCELIKGKPIELRPVDLEECASKEVLTAQQIVKVFILPIRHEGYVIGYMGIDYTHDNITITEDIKHECYKALGIIEELVTARKTSKKIEGILNSELQKIEQDLESEIFKEK